MLPEEGGPESWVDRNLGILLRLGVLIVLVIIVVLSTGYLKKIVVYINPDLKNCAEGTCKTSCIKGEEIQKQGVQCADTSRICCINNEHLISPECIDKTSGESCGAGMQCDEYRTCISKCDYCSLHSNDSSCIIPQTIGKKVNAFDDTFNCGCTEMECISFDNSKLGTCIKNERFCPSNNPNAIDGNCCSSLYKAIKR